VMERGSSLQTNNSIDAVEIERRRASIVQRGQTQTSGS
jgi:hypothetical protein